ncbi:MAG TPA: hypothetical protein EYQ63_09905 [Fuerstia sp.]|nr:hypothetical protein [Fuerstiella sp.]
MKWLRFIVAGQAFLVATWAVAPAVFAQATSPGENRTVTTADGWDIKVTYFESPSGKESPVVILLPGAEGLEESRTRKVWEGMAKALQKQGYAVVTADLRKHGDSAPDTDDVNPRLIRLGPGDYVLMATRDLEAIKAFLVTEHQRQKLNIRKLGIAAAGSSCMVAASFAANDWLKKPWPDAPTFAQRTPKGQDVRAIMMLSPKSPVKGLNTTVLIKTIADPAKRIAVHIYHNPKDRAEKKAADLVFRFLKLPKSVPDQEPRQLKEGPPDKKYSAEGLLAAKDGSGTMVMEKHTAEFFNAYLKMREDPWKTRTSKLE